MREGVSPAGTQHGQAPHPGDADVHLQEGTRVGWLRGSALQAFEVGTQTIPKPQIRASPVSLVTPQLHCSPLARARPPVSPLLHGVAKRGSVQLEEIDPKEIQHVHCLPPQWVSVKHLAWASVCVCVCVMYARAHAQNTMTCCLLFFAPVSIGSCFLKWNELKIQMLIEDTYS